MTYDLRRLRLHGLIVQPPHLPGSLRAALHQLDTAITYLWTVSYNAA